MKRLSFLIVSFMLLILSPLAAVAEISEPIAHIVYGFVGDEVTFSVDIDDTILPFNLEDPLVKKNPSPTVVTGLRIGTMFLSSNQEAFSLTISHDNLTLSGTPVSGDTGTIDTVDYRLDFFILSDSLAAQYPDAKKFISVYTGIPATITKDNFPNNDYKIIDRSIYISLNAEDTTVAALKQGAYSSTITFTLTTT